ncbi:hypothetical protein [Nonomuraea sp. NPDC048826]|uniref:hypothetical protein n=1 Tax=Nonomuraea sp. NPDC048826 TaxID=3364347 RepID=UPI0037147E44
MGLVMGLRMSHDGFRQTTVTVAIRQGRIAQIRVTRENGQSSMFEPRSQRGMLSTSPEFRAVLVKMLETRRVVPLEELDWSPSVTQFQVIDLLNPGGVPGYQALEIERRVRDIILDWTLWPMPPPSPHPPPAAARILRFASLAAVEPASEEEWRTELQELAAEGSRREIICYALGILYAGLHSRVAWLARRTCQPGISLLQWVLRSEIWTWMPLTLLTWWAATETAEDTGIGAAILLVIVSFSALAMTVNWLRDRFDAHPRRGQKAADE